MIRVRSLHWPVSRWRSAPWTCSMNGFPPPRCRPLIPSFSRIVMVSLIVTCMVRVIEPQSGQGILASVGALGFSSSGRPQALQVTTGSSTAIDHSSRRTPASPGCRKPKAVGNPRCKRWLGFPSVVGQPRGVHQLATAPTRCIWIDLFEVKDHAVSESKHTFRLHEAMVFRGCIQRKVYHAPPLGLRMNRRFFRASLTSNTHMSFSP